MAPGHRGLRVISGGRAAGTLPGAALEGEGKLPGGASRTDDLRDLYTRYGGSVYGRCLYLLKERSKAEDAMQDVFAKALGSGAKFRGESSPLTWLMTIATNHCLNLIRSERAPWRRRFEAEELGRAERATSDGGAGGAAGPRLFENREAVRKLLGRADLETQAAAIHYYVDEMTLEEVSAALGRSIPTIRKRLEGFAALCGEELRS
jgi:RNA polymerase sigma-70 factor (ECF subfamily)